MNFRSIGDAELADFAQNVATALAGGELSALDPVVRAELSAALGALPQTLSDQAQSVMAAEEERMSAVSARNETGDRLRFVLARVRDSLKASAAPPSQYELCGFKAISRSVRVYIARDPSDLWAVGTYNGPNRLGFTGKNPHGLVTYEIWRRDARTDEWYMHATTRRQRFVDEAATPGQYYEYKVRAVAARSVSNFSDIAAVWGEGGGQNR